MEYTDFTGVRRRVVKFDARDFDNAITLLKGSVATLEGQNATYTADVVAAANWARLAHEMLSAILRDTEFDAAS